MGITIFLMFAAFILLTLAGLGVGGGRFNLGWLGMATWALAAFINAASI